MHHQILGLQIAYEIAELTKHPFVTAPNKFAAQGSLDAVVAASAALRSLAIALMKIANDIRWLGCGPQLVFMSLTYQPMNQVHPLCRVKLIPLKQKHS